MNILKETFVVLSNIINYMRPHIASEMSVLCVTLFLKKVFFYPVVFISIVIVLQNDKNVYRTLWAQRSEHPSMQTR